MDKITLVKFKNPFLKHDKDVEYIEYKNETLLDLRNAHFPQNIEVVVTLNGEIIPYETQALTYPHKNNIISIMPKVEGDVLKVVAGIILVVIGLVIGYAYGWTGAGWVVGQWIAGLGVSLIIGGAMGILFPAKKPRIPTLTGEDYDSSQSYGWSPQTIQQQGLAIPKAYGTNKLYGNIIAADIEPVDTIASQFLNVLICLGIGPYNRLYNFKLNDQPIESFRGVALQARMGMLDQPVISNFNDTKIENPASVKLSSGVPYVYTTLGDNFNGLEIELLCPNGLWHANDNGGLDGLTMSFRVEIRPLGGAWQTLSNGYTSYQTSDLITTARWSRGGWIGQSDGGEGGLWMEAGVGSVDPYEHYEGEDAGPFSGNIGGLPIVNLPTYWRWISQTELVYNWVTVPVDYTTISGSATSVRRTVLKANIAQMGKYEVRLTKLSPDYNDPMYGDALYFSSCREILADDFEYPRHVLVGLKALATDQLSGSLRFSCIAECSLVRVYDGANWTVVFSSNPAWVCWDILTQPVFDNNLNVIRYDGYDPSKLDLNKFKEWADFCDTLVPDGKGGTEKRITFNGCFDMGGNLWDAVIQVCHLGRAVPIWTGSKLTLHIDKAASPVQMFTDGNIIVDSFEEVFLPKSQRATEVEIDFINSEKDYERDIATIINPNIGATEKANLQYFGLTKPSEAWRAGQYLLAYNEFLTRVISFSADVDAIACSLGDVVLLSHSVPVWGTGGRVVSAIANAITLDKEVTIEAGKTYVVLVRLSDDTRVSKTITNTPGTYSVLNVSTPYSTIPQKFDLYSFGESSIETKPFRIMDIQPSQDLQFKISAIEYNASIYNTDTGLPALPTPDYSGIEALPPVTNILLDEVLVKGKDGAINDVIDVYFDRPNNFTYSHAEIWHNKGGGWVYDGITLTGSYRINNAEINQTYQIVILTVNSAGQKQLIQNAPKASIYTLGKLDPPGNVTGFTVKQNGQFVDFNWVHIPDADLWGYEIRQGANWESAKVIASRISQNQYSWQADLNGTYRFLIKAIDDSKIYSPQAASVDITLSNINESINAILTQDEMTKGSPADGTKNNLVYISAYHALMFPHTLTDTDAPAWTDLTADITDYAGDINLDGDYTTLEIDTLMESLQTLRINEVVDAAETSATDQSYPLRTDMTYPEDVDTHITMPVDYTIWYSTKGESGGYSAYKKYNGIVQETYRYIKIKFVMNIVSQTGRFRLLNFNIILDVPDQKVLIAGLSVAIATGTDVSYSTYGKAFHMTPIVRATLINDTVNKVPVISNESATGFHIDLLDVANAKAAGAVNIEVSGY